MSTRKAFIALNRLRHAAANGGARYGLTRLILETDGQDMVEYALLTTFIGFAGAAAWTAMQTSLGNAYGACQRCGRGISGSRPIRWEAAHERHRIAMVRRVRARGCRPAGSTCARGASPTG